MDVLLSAEEQAQTKQQKRMLSNLVDNHINEHNSSGNGGNIIDGTSSSTFVRFREKITQWYYDLIDYMDEKREVVYVALNILDKYCCCKFSHDGTLAALINCTADLQTGKISGSMSKVQYQVASVASIFLALRSVGTNSQSLQLKSLVDLCVRQQHKVTESDVREAGTEIYKLLFENVIIVTPMQFVDSIMLDVLTDLPNKVELVNPCTYLVEIAAYDVLLANVKPSELAVCAVLNCLPSNVDCRPIKASIKQHMRINCESEHMNNIRLRLYAIYAQSAYGAANNTIHGPHFIYDEETLKRIDASTQQVVSHHVDGSGALIRSISNDDLVSMVEDCNDEDTNNYEDRIKKALNNAEENPRLCKRSKIV